MSRPSHARGRHRPGTTPSPFRRRPWDGQARGTAQSLDQHWQGWSVLYGPASRRFYAMVAWPVREPLILSASTAAELERLMYQAETVFSARGEIPAPVTRVAA
ncbi:hypothetical protein [Sphaerimonospora thailandensis]|uniref:Uncharacterized protein n=1 Tax=Sphaerimonospora thailandensis TaxID=795644 RepID=A0A8J3W1E2_9ACTN|nr:hypothetical protein [Sphaerimonospora thailandensis]GIH73234.1 hypothetical protein Mth01_54870 [Sphaerimonospora thailandensis]